MYSHGERKKDRERERLLQCRRRPVLFLYPWVLGSIQTAGMEWNDCRSSRQAASASISMLTLSSASSLLLPPCVYQLVPVWVSSSAPCAEGEARNWRAELLRLLYSLRQGNRTGDTSITQREGGGKTETTKEQRQEKGGCWNHLCHCLSCP